MDPVKRRGWASHGFASTSLKAFSKHLFCVILRDGWSVEAESVLMGPIVTPEENGQMAELKKRRLTHLDIKE